MAVGGGGTDSCQFVTQSCWLCVAGCSLRVAVSPDRLVLRPAAGGSCAEEILHKYPSLRLRRRDRELCLRRDQCRLDPLLSDHPASVGQTRLDVLRLHPGVPLENGLR